MIFIVYAHTFHLFYTESTAMAMSNFFFFSFLSPNNKLINHATSSNVCTVLERATYRSQESWKLTQKSSASPSLKYSRARDMYLLTYTYLHQHYDVRSNSIAVRRKLKIISSKLGKLNAETTFFPMNYYIFFRHEWDYYLTSRYGHVSIESY